MEYWESRFSKEGAMWSYEPSDSALFALKLFLQKGIRSILIPGMGYGRNAKIFYENGLDVTGIEISRSAIELAQANGLNFKMHCGSVCEMPFDQKTYQGIFAYALIHLLNRAERSNFLKNCYHQLEPGGIMIFTVASTAMSMYGQGKWLSKNRYSPGPGLKVYFYDNEAVRREFAGFGLQEFRDIAEPVKFIKDQEPIRLKIVICSKPHKC